MFHRFRLLIGLGALILVCLSTRFVSAQTAFVRGDANGDQTVNVSDVLASLDALFISEFTSCRDAIDANDDGSLGIGDPIYLLSFLFLSGPAPAIPFPACGVDESGDGIDCLENWGGCDSPSFFPLLPLTASSSDVFGTSVTIEGEVALVGAPDNPLSLEPGSIFLFRRTSGVWTQETELLPVDGEPEDQFGSSVALSGEVAVVGIPGDDDVDFNSGAAAVYRFNGSEWVFEQKLVASDGSLGDGFGLNVAISGDAIAVGVRKGSLGALPSAVYLFRFDGSEWLQEQKIVRGFPKDKFGRALDLDGDRLLAGSPRDDDQGTNAGSAYLFEYSGIEWIETAFLTPNDGAAGDEFGASVALGEETIFIASPRADESTPALEDSGAVYTFILSGSSWVQDQKLTAIAADSDDNFGISIAVQADRFVVGAPGVGGLGAAALFERTGNQWQQIDTFATNSVGESFGRAVALDGNDALFGAPESTLNGSGSAYLFGLSP